MDILASITYRISHLSSTIEKKSRMKWLDDRHRSRITKGTVLNQEQKDNVRKYWDKYCNIRFSGHEFYLEKTGVFDPRFIPDSVHFRIIDRYLNNWAMAKCLDNKCYYPRMFSGIKMPLIVAYRLNGYWYNNESKIIDYKQVVDYVNIRFDKGVFIKAATDSYGGKGVWYYNPAESKSSDFNVIISKIKTDIIVQEGIRQSKTISRLNESSVNTIRFISLLKSDGTVKIYSTILRMGIGDSKVDNATSGGITVGIQTNGRLKPVAYSAKGVRYDEHPTSHVKFDEVVIPGFDKIKEIILSLHPQVPHFRLVSWDIAIDENEEPVFIEANLCDGEIDFHQLNNGPLFGEDTEIILNEVFNK